MTTTATTERRATCNSGLMKVAVQWLNQVPFFNQFFVQFDSFVLRNRHLRVVEKRYVPH